MKSSSGDAGAKLSHVDASDSARMVDVSGKEVTPRMARARGTIRMNSMAFEAIRRHTIAKGDVVSVARVAGIMAAKKTADLVPLCHPLPLDDVQVEVREDPALPGLVAESIVRTTGRTGVEMEAIVAVTVTLVTVYDMAKGVDKEMVIGDISLVEKTGGKSGPFRASR
ncbi:MAG TPA: cyclic pyranopterin monophosphate synthase MoaC [Gemmatimonadaceae bacterium]|nr:cyclic pyranopterin monophosphate synthase MoaC [Gemmatimonadaceae bacterium]